MRCAIRNRQFIGYTLGPLECNVRGRLFDSEGGGERGSQNFVWTDNLFSAWARPGNFFHVAWARGKYTGDTFWDFDMGRLYHSTYNKNIVPKR